MARLSKGDEIECWISLVFEGGSSKNKLKLELNWQVWINKFRKNNNKKTASDKTAQSKLHHQ